MEKVSLPLVIRHRRCLWSGLSFLTYCLLNKLTTTLNSISVQVWTLSHVKPRTFLALGLHPHSGEFPSPSIKIHNFSLSALSQWTWVWLSGHCHPYCSTIVNQSKVLPNLIVSNPFTSPHLYLASLGLHYFMRSLWHWLLNVTLTPYKVQDDPVLAHLSHLKLPQVTWTYFSCTRRTTVSSLSRSCTCCFHSLNILLSSPLMLDNSSFSVRRSWSKTTVSRKSSPTIPSEWEVPLQTLALWTISTRALKYCVWLAAYLPASRLAIDYCVPGTWPRAGHGRYWNIAEWLNQWRKYLAQ